MAVSLNGPVGLRHRVQSVANGMQDQAKTIGLLAMIAAEQGGKKGAWMPPPPPGPNGQCPRGLADAIWDFQTLWNGKGVLRKPDGVVDPGGATLAKMNELATVTPAGPPTLDPGAIVVQQAAPPQMTALQQVANVVVSIESVSDCLFEGMAPGSIPPGTPRPPFVEGTLLAEIRQLLFRVFKGGRIFWVGAAIPKDTADFTRAQLYFHPTVINGGNVVAKDGDYESFGGGWTGQLYRYVPMQGGQLAAVAPIPLLVPFTTMAALRGGADNMFSDRPVETLQAVMDAIQREVAPTAPPTKLAQIGVSSFSSGVSALRQFVSIFGGNGLIREINDFDSPYIISEHGGRLTHAAGAVSRVFAQTPPRSGARTPGWITLPPPRWKRVLSYGSVHAKMGFMTYAAAMWSSPIVTAASN